MRFVPPSGAHPAPAVGSARLGSAGPQVSRRSREVAARGGAGRRADRDILPSAPYARATPCKPLRKFIEAAAAAERGINTS